MTTVEEGKPAVLPGPSAAIPVVPPPKKKRSILVRLSYVWLGGVVLLAVFAGFLPLSSYSVPVDAPRLSPGFGSLDTLLGTDSIGRSILSRAVHGAQVSLVVGVIAGLTGFVIGTTLGLLGGYFGRRVDWVILLVADTLLAFPPLILLLALASMLTPSVTTILLGLSVVTVPTFTRLARASTLSWSSREFVRAAKNMGATSPRILVKELLPNVLPAVGAYLPIVIAALIVAEGSLSFLGLGIPPPTPSWGGMINDGKDAIARNPHMVFVPASIIFLTVFSLNQTGDHLRSKFDRTLQH